MSRLKKVMRNIIILVILFFLVHQHIGLYLTPLSAHKSLERRANYGPSEVIHVVNRDEGKYLLCKYDKWVSCNTVNRRLGFFWSPGSHPIGFENDKKKVINYSWNSSATHYKFYGVINDNDIKKVEIILNNGEIIEETELYEDLFLFTWKVTNNIQMGVINIKGYDAEDNMIFEEEHRLW